MQYKWLFFDADNTLFNFDLAQKNALSSMLEFFALNSGAKQHQIYSEINKKVWHRFEKGMIKASQVSNLRFKLFFEAIGAQIEPYSASDKYLEYLSENRQLFSGVEALLQMLSKTHNLLLITNGLKKVQRKRLANSPVTGLFKDIIISEEVGIAKPDKEIFQYALKRNKIEDKSKVLMIGDNLKTDILGAQNAGIDSCWFNYNGSQNNSAIAPTYTINKMGDLPKLLKI